MNWWYGQPASQALLYGADANREGTEKLPMDTKSNLWCLWVLGRLTRGVSCF